MRPRSKRLAMLACLVLAATGLAACQGAGSVVNSDVDYCTIMADPPVKDGSKMAAPGRYRCDGKGADSITITVTLQKQASNGSWHSVKTGTWTAKGTDTSRTLSETQRTRNTVVSCANGEYRTLVHSVEKSRKHTFDYVTHSVTVNSPCKR